LIKVPAGLINMAVTDAISTIASQILNRAQKQSPILLAASASFAIGFLLRFLFAAKQQPEILPSPCSTHLPHLSEQPLTYLKTRDWSTQILLALVSLPSSWTGSPSGRFALAGFSMGGDIAVAFISYFPRLVSSLILLALSGLVRKGHIDTRSRGLY